jgi:hypothetical protein
MKISADKKQEKVKHYITEKIEEKCKDTVQGKGSVCQDQSCFCLIFCNPTDRMTFDIAERGKSWGGGRQVE